MESSSQTSLVNAVVEINGVTISVVSHGQGSLVSNLLDDIDKYFKGDFDVVLTINVPECEEFIRREFNFPLLIIRNPSPKGFGANHNSAFRQSAKEYFAVVNPDIRLQASRIDLLMDVLMDASIGVVGPAVFNPEGSIEDSARRFPRILSMIKRRVKRTFPRDYPLDAEENQLVDWLAGMFLVFPRSVYGDIMGFDEKYFMYMEDVEICRRLRGAGKFACFVPSCKVVHDAQRQSHHSLQHFKWHVFSAVRYFISVN